MNGGAVPPRIAVVGAASLIGEALIRELRARKFGIAEMHALEEARELGRQVEDEERNIPVGDVAAFDFSRIDLAFFCGRASVSARYAEAAAAHAWVIDGSSTFRGRADVPLVAADVNGDVLGGLNKPALIALPGSASVALVTVLAPLHALAGLEDVEVATYHAVSGSGRGAMEGLAAETVDLLGGRQPKVRSYSQQIAFNVIPQVDALDADGVSGEERRLLDESRRVLALPDLRLNATAVRVPVFFGHGLAVHARFSRALSVADAEDLLQRSNGVSVTGGASAQPLPTPAAVALSADRVHVGRLRSGMMRDRSLNFWIVADNVRKCAAYNAVSAAQILVNGGH